MEGYLNNADYEFISTPNDGQCAIHSIVEVANLIAREKGIPLITDQERAGYIEFLIEAIQNPDKEYFGAQTSTHHEIEPLLLLINTLRDEISNRLRPLIFNKNGDLYLEYFIQTIVKDSHMYIPV